MQKRRAGCLECIVLSAAILGMTMSCAAAQPSHRSSRKSQPPPLARTAPDETSTIDSGKPQNGKPQNSKPQTGKAEPAKPPVLATVDFGETLPKPFDLPASSRPRMRACGEKWQAIKMSGQAGSDTWREFATKCLTERESVAGKTSP